MKHAFYAHLLLQKVAETSAMIYLPVREEIGFPQGIGSLHAAEHGIHHIHYIDKGDFLWLVANGKVYMPCNAAGHQEIVLLPGTIHTGGAQNRIGEVRQ